MTNSAGYSILTVNEIEAAFPKQLPSKIPGRPTFELLTDLLPHFIQCGQAVKCPAVSSTMNLLSRVMPPELYAHYTNEAYPANTYPFPQSYLNAAGEDMPDLSMINDNDTVAIANATNRHNLAKQTYLTVERMDQALTNRLLSLMDEAYINEFITSKAANPNMPFREVFHFFFEKYGDVQPETRQKIRADMETFNWNPIDGFEALSFQLTKGIHRRVMCGHPLEMQDIVDIGTLVIRKTNKYTQEMKEWSEQVDGATLTDFTNYWSKKIKTADNATDAASKYGYGMMMDESDISNEELNNAIGQFGEAHSAQQQTMAALAATNKQQQDQLQMMQQMLCQMQLAQQQNQQQPQIVMMPPPAYPTSNNNSNRTNQQGGYATAANWIAANNGGKPKATPVHQLTSPQQIKIRPLKGGIGKTNNWNYCSTHGGDVADDHDSKSCTRQACWHNVNATRQNPMGGNMQGMDKKLLPMQAGKKAHVPKRLRGTSYGNRGQAVANNMMQMPMCMPTNMPSIGICIGICSSL